jgi:hypothetical protein
MVTLLVFLNLSVYVCSKLSIKQLTLLKRMKRKIQTDKCLSRCKKVKKEECGICMEGFTKQLRRRVECNKCHKIVCSDCLRIFICRNNTSLNSKCPSCPEIFARDFLVVHLGKSFMINKFKIHVTDTLFAEATLLFPQTQMYLQEVEEYRTQIKSLVTLRHERDDLMTKLVQGSSELINRFVLSFNIKEKHDEIMMCFERRLLVVNNIINRIEHLQFPTSTDEDNTIQKLPRYIQVCPMVSCKGFVEKSTMQCALCKAFICKHCRQTDLIDHVCDMDDVKTQTYLNKETKSCPKCKTPISKVSGCNQMFCVSCTTFFCWKTGEELPGQSYHNPHYFEYIRNNPIPLQQHNNWVPDERSTLTVLSNILIDQPHVRLEMRNFFERFFMLSGHLMWELNRMISRNRVYNTPLDLRIAFMQNKIKEQKFKDYLYVIYIKGSKLVQLLAIVQLLTIEKRRILLEFLSAENIDHVLYFQEQTTQLFDIIQYRLDSLSVSFNCTIPSVNKVNLLTGGPKEFCKVVSLKSFSLIK